MTIIVEKSTSYVCQRERSICGLELISKRLLGCDNSTKVNQFNYNSLRDRRFNIVWTVSSEMICKKKNVFKTISQELPLSV